MASANNRNSRLISYEDSKKYKLIHDMIIDVEMNPKKYLKIQYISIFLTREKTQDEVIKCLLETLNQIYGFCVMNFDYLFKLSGSDYVKTANNNSLLRKFNLSYNSMTVRGKNDVSSLGIDIQQTVNNLIDSNKTDEEKKGILLDGIQSLFEFNCGYTGGKLFFNHVRKFIDKVSSSMIDDKDNKYFDLYLKDMTNYIEEIRNVDKSIITKFKEEFNTKIVNYRKTEQKFNLFINELLDEIVKMEEPKRNGYKTIIYTILYNRIIGPLIKEPINATIFYNTFGNHSKEILEYINENEFNDLECGTCKYKDLIYHTCDENTIYSGVTNKLCPLMDITQEKPETDQGKIKSYLEEINIRYCIPKQINTSKYILINKRSTSRRSKRGTSRRSKRGTSRSIIKK